ncbi:MAG: DMT family transporter [Actinomycetota bacterium]
MTTFGPTTPTHRWQPGPATATATIVFCAVAYFARRLTDAGIAPVSVALARFALIAVVLGPTIRFDRPMRRATVWGMGSGAAMAIGWIAYVDAIDTGSVASAGVIYMTYPLFTLAALWVMFGLRPTSRQMIGGLLVVAAAVITLGVGTGVSWVVLATPATFGAAIAVLTERLDMLDPVERVAAVGLGAAVTLTPLVLRRPPAEVLPADAGGWLWLLALSFGCTLLPMTAYAWAAPHIGGARASVAGATELPAVLLMGSVLLGEALAARELASAALIGTAIVIVNRTGSVEEPPPSTVARNPDDEARIGLVVDHRGGVELDHHAGVGRLG